MVWRLQCVDKRSRGARATAVKLPWIFQWGSRNIRGNLTARQCIKHMTLITFNMICQEWLVSHEKNGMSVSSTWQNTYSTWDAMELYALTHWGRVTHICVGNLTIIGSDNGLSPGRRQAIIWTNAGILLIGHWGTNFSEILIGIQTFSFKKMHLKMSSAKWRPFCPGPNVLKGVSNAIILASGDGQVICPCHIVGQCFLFVTQCGYCSSITS